MLSLVFFFFSIRRRHTSWPRYWSSDVCSSDLAMVAAGLAIIYLFPLVTKAIPSPLVCIVVLTAFTLFTGLDLRTVGDMRSEERRVGKEWRSRGTRDH